MNNFKSSISVFLCTEIYISKFIRVSLIKILLRIFPSLKNRMIKMGRVKIYDNEIDLSNYYKITGPLISSTRYEGLGLFYGCVFLPLWLLIGKILSRTWNFDIIIYVFVVLSFVLPIIVLRKYVLNDDELKKYWKQMLVMPLSKRRKLILITCIIAIVLKSLFCLTWIICIPIINNM